MIVTKRGEVVNPRPQPPVDLVGKCLHCKTEVYTTSDDSSLLAMTSTIYASIAATYWSGGGEGQLSRLYGHCPVCVVDKPMIALFEKTETVRPSETDLRQKIRDGIVQLGGVHVTYRHVKSGEYYVAYGVALEESTLRLLVVYVPYRNSGNGLWWSRPLDEFLARFVREEPKPQEQETL